MSSEVGRLAQFKKLIEEHELVPADRFLAVVNESSMLREGGFLDHPDTLKPWVLEKALCQVMEIGVFFASWYFKSIYSKRVRGEMVVENSCHALIPGLIPRFAGVRVLGARGVSCSGTGASVSARADVPLAVVYVSDNSQGCIETRVVFIEPDMHYLGTGVDGAHNANLLCPFL